jgi:hypothetical protein
VLKAVSHENAIANQAIAMRVRHLHHRRAVAMYSSPNDTSKYTGTYS